MNYIYFLEALFLRIFVKPLFHWIERLTGFSSLEMSYPLGMLSMLISLICLVINYFTPGVSFNGHSDAFKAILLPFHLFTIAYSIHLIKVAFNRSQSYYQAEESLSPTRGEDEKNPTEDTYMKAERKNWIARDPVRLFWCFIAIILFIVIHHHGAKYPFIVYAFFPFCFFGPTLMFCGIRPYFKATEIEQEERKNKSAKTTLTLIFLGFLLIAYFVSRSD